MRVAKWLAGAVAVQTIVVVLMLAAIVLSNSYQLPAAEINIRSAAAAHWSLDDPLRDFIDYDVCLASGMGIVTLPGGRLRQALLSPTFVCEREEIEADPPEEDDDEVFVYWRFWHGYQLLTKPLIALGVGPLRGFLLLSLVSTTAAFLFLLWRQVGLISLAAALGLLCMPISWEFFGVNITLVWSLGALAATGLMIRAGFVPTPLPLGGVAYFLMIVGGMTTFLDWFTVPLITLLLPLLSLLFARIGRDERLLIDAPLFKSYMVLSAAWAFGYVSTWSSKWLLVAMLTEEDVLGLLIPYISYRLNGMPDEGRIGVFEVIGRNLAEVPVALVLTGLFALASLVKGFKLRVPVAADSLAAAAFLVILPFVFYAVARQHSLAHSWYTANLMFPAVATVLAVAQGVWLRERR